MQNINMYTKDLQTKLDILIKEYNTIKNKITEEEFSFELKRKKI